MLRKISTEQVWGVIGTICFTRAEIEPEVVTETDDNPFIPTPPILIVPGPDGDFMGGGFAEPVPAPPEPMCPPLITKVIFDPQLNDYVSYLGYRDESAVPATCITRVSAPMGEILARRSIQP